MFPSRRRRLFVDFKLQGMLLAHVAIYWVYCLLSVTLVACCWVVLVQRPATSVRAVSHPGPEFRSRAVGLDPPVAAGLDGLPAFEQSLCRPDGAIASSDEGTRQRQGGSAGQIRGPATSGLSSPTTSIG